MTASPQLRIAWSTADWANAIAELPADGPLPVRTVLVPNGRIAHALRRELVRGNHLHALAGTLFRPIHLAAEDVLREAGTALAPGEESLRPARLASLFREGLDLRYFEPSLLRTARGWEDAFAQTISDLEAAGLRPEDLRDLTADDPRAADVASIWTRVDEMAATSWSTHRIIAEAARLLAERPELWPHHGSVIAPAAADLSMATARFFRALPRCTLALLAARPLRSRHLERAETLLGHDAREALEAAALPRRGDSEKHLLDSFLFEPADVLGDPSRPRSRGPDGTVALEEHASVEEEIDAAAGWVVREIMEHGTPLEEIAVLLPAHDHLIDLVAARIEGLPWKDGKPFPVFAAGGRLLTSWSGGAHVLAVVRALRMHLAAESLVSVLTCLRVTDEGGSKAHLSYANAMRLAYGLGTLGGNPAHPEAACDWDARLAFHEARLQQAALENAEADTSENEDRASADLLKDILAVRHGIAALVDVARLVVNDGPLSDVWARLKGFLSSHVAPRAGTLDVTGMIGEALTPLCADSQCASATGQDALAVIEDIVRGLRVSNGRFGDPAVYVGTIESAVGLPFAAVRVMGLVEGVLPAQPREDAVLPDERRAAITELARTEDRTIAQLHALDRVVRDAGRIALSSPRLDAGRVEREPSSVLLEAAAALARPNAVTGEPSSSVVPDTRALRRDAFSPARAAAEEFRAGHAIRPSDWSTLAARGSTPLPSSWNAVGAFDLARLLVLRADGGPAGPLDGILLPSANLTSRVPGLTPDRPTSASALSTLVGCPHQLLLERILRFRPPSPPPGAGTIDSLPYGSLFHSVAEDLYRQHGLAICRREQALDEWKVLAREIARRHFQELLEGYPLVGAEVRGQQLARLLRDVERFLDYEWSGPPREFRAVELRYGYDEPLSIDLDEGPLFVRGFIDRVDVENGRTLVRDLKTGKAHPRAGNADAPDHGRDLQIALYGMVLRKLADRLGLPTQIAAAYVYMDPHEPERAFRDDFDTLESEARDWLSAARRLLGSAAFPRTPNADDCRYCDFKPVCGPHAHRRALSVLEDTRAVTEPFHRLKGAPCPDSGDGSEE